MFEVWSRRYIYLSINYRMHKDMGYIELWKSVSLFNTLVTWSFTWRLWIAEGQRIVGFQKQLKMHGASDNQIFSEE